MRQMSIGFPSIKTAGLPRSRSYRQDHSQAGSGDWQVICTGTRLIPSSAATARRCTPLSTLIRPSVNVIALSA
jgi:hypothetical protein